jgi:hypothetical protein
MLHGLALLTLMRWEPQRAALQTRSSTGAPLIVRLIMPDVKQPLSGSDPPHARISAEGQSRKMRAAPQSSATPPAVAVANGASIERGHRDIDWQADLQSIGNNMSQERRVRRPGWPVAQAPQPASPVQRETLASEISTTARPDCRNAHAQMGQLAIPMLAVDAVKRSGCRW